MPAPFGGMSRRLPASMQMTNPLLGIPGVRSRPSPRPRRPAMSLDARYAALESGDIRPDGTGRLPADGGETPAPSRMPRGLRYMRDLIGGVGGAVGSAMGMAADNPEVRRAIATDQAMRDQARNNDFKTGLLQALAPYVDVARAGMDLGEAGRIAEDKRTEFLRNAYENYGNPTEGYYALPRVMGSGGVDPNMFTGHDQAAIDNARRKFMATHAWARKKKHAADVDVAVKYLLDKGHKFYT